MCSAIGLSQYPATHGVVTAGLQYEFEIVKEGEGTATVASFSTVRMNDLANTDLPAPTLLRRDKGLRDGLLVVHESANVPN